MPFNKSSSSSDQLKKTWTLKNQNSQSLKNEKRINSKVSPSKDNKN